MAWREQVEALEVRWRALADEIGAPAVASVRELAQLVACLDAVLVEAAEAMQVLDKVFAQFVPAGGSPRNLSSDPARLSAAAETFRNAVAAAQLAASKAEVARLKALFPVSTGKVGKLARDFLAEAVGRERVEVEQVARLWFALRRLIGQLNQHRAAFDVVRAVTSALEAAGAPIWARRLRSEPAESQADPLIPADWRNAWDWAAAVAFLKLIDDRERLKALADERVRLDVEIRKTLSSSFVSGPSTSWGAP